MESAGACNSSWKNFSSFSEVSFQLQCVFEVDSFDFIGTEVAAFAFFSVCLIFSAYYHL